MTIEDAIATFLDEAGQDSEETKSTYRTALNRFIEFLSDNDLSPAHDASMLTLPHARGFIGWLGKYRNLKTGQPLARATRALYILGVSLFFRRLILDKVIQAEWQDYVNYRANLRKTKKEKTPLEKKLPPNGLVTDMLERVELAPEIGENISAGDRQRIRLTWLRDRAIVHCLHSSGMRVGELVKLRRGDLRSDKQGTYVLGKSDKERLVRFSNKAWGVLHEYLDARDGNTGLSLAELPVFAQHSRRAGQRILPISTRLVERVVSRIANQAGSEIEFDMHPHSFRHYFGTKFYRSTGDLALTQDALGHSDPGTTRIYAETSEEDIEEAHRRLFDGIK